VLLVKFFKPRRDVPPDALLVLVVLDIGDNACFALLFRQTRDVIAPLSILEIARSWMIEM
jgi:hypothetical protein